MLNLGHTAYATTASSQHCFLGTQMQKHLLWKQRVSEKNETFFVSKCFHNKCSIHVQMGEAQCFCKNVPSFVGALRQIYLISLSIVLATDMSLITGLLVIM